MYTLECDICGKPIWGGEFYIEEAFLKQEQNDAERFYVRIIPVTVCLNCKEGEKK